MQKTINTLTALAQNNPNIEILWLYGSRAKGTASANSDYDLAVAFKTREPNPVTQRLRPELLAQEWADSLALRDAALSVVDIDQTPIPLATSVVTTGQVLHCNNPLRLATTENRITAMWEIDYLYHHKHYGPTETAHHG